MRSDQVTFSFLLSFVRRLAAGEPEAGPPTRLLLRVLLQHHQAHLRTLGLQVSTTLPSIPTHPVQLYPQSQHTQYGSTLNLNTPSTILP
eukprot:1734032-Rhodomonas_salina.1